MTNTNDGLSERVEGVTLAAGLMASVVLIILAYPGIRAWVGPGYGTSATVLMRAFAMPAGRRPITGADLIFVPILCNAK